jgi:hypothetical protein
MHLTVPRVKSNSILGDLATQCVQLPYPYPINRAAT